MLNRVPGGHAGDRPGVGGGGVGDGPLDLARLEVEDAEGAVAVAHHGAAPVGKQLGALGPLSVTWNHSNFIFNINYRVSPLVVSWV